MKNISILSLSVLSLLLTHSARAATVAETYESFQSITCVSALEYSLAAVAFASDEAKEAILYNIDQYEAVVKDIKKNAISMNAVNKNKNFSKAVRQKLAKKYSNASNFKTIAESLAARENDAVYGIEIGKGVVSCLRPLLSFTETPAQQNVTASAALIKLQSIRNSVQ